MTTKKPSFTEIINYYGFTKYVEGREVSYTWKSVKVEKVICPCTNKAGWDLTVHGVLTMQGVSKATVTKGLRDCLGLN